MNDQLDKQSSIVSRIIDGSITIDSVAELENLLKAFPNNPWLHKVFADLLKRDKSFMLPLMNMGRPPSFLWKKI